MKGTLVQIKDPSICQVTESQSYTYFHFCLKTAFTISNRIAKEILLHVRLRQLQNVLATSHHIISDSSILNTVLLLLRTLAMCRISMALSFNQVVQMCLTSRTTTSCLWMHKQKSLCPRNVLNTFYIKHVETNFCLSLYN